VEAVVVIVSVEVAIPPGVREIVFTLREGVGPESGKEAARETVPVKPLKLETVT